MEYRDPFLLDITKQKKNFYIKKNADSDAEFLSQDMMGKKEFLGTTIPPRHVLVYFLFISAIFFGLMARLAYLQIARGDEYYALAEGNRIRLIPTPSSRGVIFDRRHEQMVKNIPKYSLITTPVDLPKKFEDRQTLLQSVFRTIDIVAEKQATIAADLETAFKKRRYASYDAIVLADDLTHEQAVELEVVSSTLPGIGLLIQEKRKYVFSGSFDEKGGLNTLSSLSHVLGYTGKMNADELKIFTDQGYFTDDSIGKTGLEKHYESIMHGTYGQKKIEVDALGKLVKELAIKEGKDGDNLVLTIDTSLQDAVEKIVIDRLQKEGKEKAVVILLEPDSGEILASVSHPSYDSNDFVFTRSEVLTGYFTDETKPLLNRAIAGEYPSGSVFKPIVAAAALEEGIITPRTSVLSRGGIRINDWFFPDWKAGGHGITDVTKALAESVNTFFYSVGGGYENIAGLGVDNITDYARAFGLGQVTGIDLYGEKDGFLPSREWKQKVKGEAWYIGDTYHLAIGQGDLLVTPMQVAAYVAAFANGGRLYQPHVLKSVEDEDGNVVGTIQGSLIRENMVDPDHVRTVRRGLRQAVVSGSAKEMQSIGVSSAGKTGTAQFSSDKEPHSWYVGFAPYDRPGIVIAVLVEEGGEGSGIALQIARDILTYYFGDFHKT